MKQAWTVASVVLTGLLAGCLSPTAQPRDDEDLGLVVRADWHDRLGYRFPTSGSNLTFGLVVQGVDSALCDIQFNATTHASAPLPFALVRLGETPTQIWASYSFPSTRLHVSNVDTYDGAVGPPATILERMTLSPGSYLGGWSGLDEGAPDPSLEIRCQGGARARLSGIGNELLALMPQRMTGPGGAHISDAQTGAEIMGKLTGRFAQPSVELFLIANGNQAGILDIYSSNPTETKPLWSIEDLHVDGGPGVWGIGLTSIHKGYLSNVLFLGVVFGVEPLTEGSTLTGINVFELGDGDGQ